jgi:hypothetical protein
VEGGYRLRELGFLEFERVCEALLDAAGVTLGPWSGGLAELRSALAPRGVPSGLLPSLPGPARVAVCWCGERSPYEALLQIEPEAGEPLLVLLDAPLVRVRVQRAKHLLVRWVPMVRALPGVTLLGAAEIGSLLDARPDLLLRRPSLLGVCDLGPRLDPQVVADSTLDIDAARSLARVFVPTQAHARAVELLRRHRFAVLTGPPEMGKTAIARMVALARLVEGWEGHECTRPEQLWQAFARDRPQVFVADDAFGSTEYHPDAAERWALELPRVLQALDERHWLVWTSRPAPLQAGLRRIHREHGTERFPQPAEVQVDAARLGIDEKAVILYRHVRASEPSRGAVRLVQRYGWEIVSHPHLTPERIRRLAHERLARLVEAEAERLSGGELSAAVIDEIREPSRAMIASFRALAPEHRALLVGMLDAPLGPVPARLLAASARRHADAALPHSPPQLVDRLADHFLRHVPPDAVDWIHPSWRDLVIEQLADDAAVRRRFLERCSIDGVLLALSSGGGASGERQLPLLWEDSDWDALGGRLHGLLDSLDDRQLLRLLAALAGALKHDGTPHDRRELAALADVALRRLQGAWDASRAPVPVGLLGAWIVLADQLPEPPPDPSFAHTWIELAPSLRGSRSLAADEKDEWLQLARLLQRYRPQAFARLHDAHMVAVPRAQRPDPIWLGEPDEIETWHDPDPMAVDDRLLVAAVLSDLDGA